MVALLHTMSMERVADASNMPWYVKKFATVNHISSTDALGNGRNAYARQYADTHIFKPTNDSKASLG